MKNQKQNNPAVVAILLCILAGLGFKIVTQLRGGEVAAPTASAPQETNASPAEMKEIASIPTAEGRDPFFHPSLKQAVKSATGETGTGTVSELGETGFAMDSGFDAFGKGASGGEDFPGSIATAKKDDGKGAGKPAGNAVAPAGMEGLAHPGGSSLPTPEIAEDEWVRTVKLTAVLGGAHPLAILEGVGAQPLAVRLDDHVGKLRVAAIHALEIVLSGERGIWTVPLQTVSESAMVPSESSPTPGKSVPPGSPLMPEESSHGQH